MDAAAQTRGSAADSFAEADARARVVAYLAARGVRPAEQPLLEKAGSFGVSIIADFPAENPTRTAHEEGAALLIVAAPLSTSARSAGAPLDPGVQALLGLADRWAKRGPPIPVRLAFLADERSELPEDLRGLMNPGLRCLLADTAGSERAALVYVDVSREDAGVMLRHGADTSVAPLYLLTALLDSFREKGNPIPIDVPFNELYRMGLVRGSSAIATSRELGVPCVLIASSLRSDAPVLLADVITDSLIACVPRIAAATGSSDERYTLVAMGGAYLILTEPTTVYLFLAVTALLFGSFLIYSLTHRRLLVARWNVFLRRFWVIPTFLAALFVCVRAAGILLDFLLFLAGSAATANPYGAAALKILLSIALYYVVALLFRGRAIPKRAHFYGSAATTCLAAGALIAAAIDFTFVPVFIWAFAFSFLSSALKSPTAAFIPAVLAPLQIAGAAAAAVGSGDPRTAYAVLSSAPFDELYLAFIALPFIFLFRRAAILYRAHALSKISRAPADRWRWITRPVFLLGCILAAGVFAVDSAPIESASRMPPRIRREAAADELRVTSQESVFLNRRTIRLTMRSAERPLRFDISLRSSERIVLYESPFPFDQRDDGRLVTLTTGERPPNPLTFELTMPADLAVVVHVESLQQDATLSARTSAGGLR